MHRGARAVKVLGLTLGALSLAACTGHGKYTKEGISLAEERMTLMKSATEWDLARQAFLGGDLDKALRKVDMSISINDGVLKSHVLRGRILIEMGDLTRAIESLERAEEINPESSDPQYYLGVVYERLTRPGEALARFGRAFELDPASHEYAVAAAEMMIDLGRTGEARDFLEGIEAHGTHAGIRQTLGQIALIEGDTVLAEHHLRDARLLSPDDDRILEQLIHAQMVNGNFGEAERLIAQLLEDPEHKGRRDLKLTHARSLMGSGNALRARQIFQALVSDELGTSDVESWSGLAHAALAIEDDRTARRAASRVVSLAPTSSDGYALWAMIHRASGDLDAALVSIGDAIKRAPQNAELYALRAIVLGEMGEGARAAQNATHAAALDPSGVYEGLVRRFTVSGRVTVVEDQ